MKKHNYSISVEWTGNKGSGTFDYRTYSRDHRISSPCKSKAIEGSSDSAFYGDDSKFNPEELLISSISSCQMLWYLHICAKNDIIVLDYKDKPHGVLQENKNGSGYIEEVTLEAEITISDETKIDLALELYYESHKMCFIANSCNFDIKHKPQINA